MTRTFPGIKESIDFGDAAGPERPAVPTITASGRAVRKLRPTSGALIVNVVGRGETREEAWTRFQERLTALRDALGGDAVVGNAIPDEDQEETSRKLRTVLEHVVSSAVEVTFSPSRFAEVIDALIRCGLPVPVPRFSYGDLAEITPDLLTEASADARRNAIAVVSGVDARVGRLVSITIGAPVRRSVRISAQTLMEELTSVNYMRTVSPDTFSFDEEKLETFNSEVHVTVEYEVVDEYAAGVAQ